MRIATWNVNSIRVRLPRLLTWLETARPDAVCLQETKVVDADFPRAEIEARGYQVELWGQKTYNGVAILSRTPMTEVRRGFADAGDDTQARSLAATINGVRVIGVYVPNGQAVGTDKYAYKLAWLARLAVVIEAEAARHPRLLLCGDMNVAPTEADVWDPKAWRDQVLCSDAERAGLAAVLATGGLVDVVRARDASPGLFSWWDYRGMSFFKNHGLRIDHVFVSPALAATCTGCHIDRDQRKGDQPSDHAPVWADFELG